MPHPIASPPRHFIGAFTPDSPLDAVAEWQRHVDAGRIGNRQPMDPAILANLLATEALVCRRPRRGVW